MKQFLIREDQGRYFAINSAGVLAWNASRQLVVDKLIAAGLSQQQAESAVSEQASPAEWFGTLTNSLANSVGRIEDSITAFQEQYATDKLTSEMEGLYRDFMPLLTELRESSLRAEREDLTAELYQFDLDFAEEMAAIREATGRAEVAREDYPDTPAFRRLREVNERLDEIEAKLGAA